MRKIIITESEFDPYTILTDYQKNSMQGKADYGATASFVGTMRDFNEGDSVTTMTLEHYPKMTEKQLGEICQEAEKQWPLLNTLIVHRVGEIHPADSIVLVAVWSSHRAAAFDACRFLMEALKSRAPFWKRETLTDGEARWVKKNTKG